MNGSTFIDKLISEYLEKEPRVRKRSEAKSQEFTSLLRAIFANLIISRDEPVIISLMTWLIALSQVLPYLAAYRTLKPDL